MVLEPVLSLITEVRWESVCRGWLSAPDDRAAPTSAGSNRHSFSCPANSEAILAERAAIKPRLAPAHKIAGRQLGTRLGNERAPDPPLDRSKAGHAVTTPTIGPQRMRLSGEPLVELSNTAFVVVDLVVDAERAGIVAEDRFMIGPAQ